MYPLGKDRFLANIASQDKPGPSAKLQWLFFGVAQTMRHMRNGELKTLALPRIGCGIGGLKWDEVEEALKQLEREFGVEVVIYDMPITS